MHQIGFKNYLGIDIVGIHISRIKKEIDGFQGDLRVADVGVEKIEYKDADVIFMIDVSQHIVSDKKLEFCLSKNVLDNLEVDPVSLDR